MDWTDVSNENPISEINANSADPRVFLGFERPPLVTAAEWLLNRFRLELPDENRFDLSNVIVVVPTMRAQNRLLQLLVKRVEGLEGLFTPPRITTLGQLPEFLYRAAKPLASDLTQQIAWTKVLEQSSKAQMECLTGRDDIEDGYDWRPMATLVANLHARLANDIWSFSSVSREVKNYKGFLKEEANRWDVLSDLQKRYYQILGEVELWDKQAARNFAAAGLMKANEIRCQTDFDIVLVGTADINRSVAEMLKQVQASNSQQVSILVAAPEVMAAAFDEIGSLETGYWVNHVVDFADEKILIADQPADQADGAARYITNLSFELAADEITIGVPDPAIIPQLERTLNSVQLKHRNLAGVEITHTAPVRLLLACRDYLEGQSYTNFAGLVRHPDLYRWLCDCVDDDGWLQSLNDYQNNNLPSSLGLFDNDAFGSPELISTTYDPTDDGAQQRAGRLADSTRILNQVHRALSELLGSLAGGEDSKVRPIGEWAAPWITLLQQIYGECEFDRQDVIGLKTLRACEAVCVALSGQNAVPELFGTEVSATESLNWALESAAEQRVVESPDPEAVELAGWLDLALDDAPVMVITSMNDEYVPTSEVGHQFLPNELCKELKILDNDRRYARDAYALTVISSVRENFLLIAGRRASSGEPGRPSRLLFTDRETSARRAKAFFDYGGSPESKLWITSQVDFPNAQQIEIPVPDAAVPKNISVTKFKDFIQCPYRFYLKHIMRLQATDDDWSELSGGTFGDLAHNVLEAFGKSDVRDATDEARIREFLFDKLNQLVTFQFAGSRLPAVRIQVEQLRLRFERFAQKQVKVRRDGWRIVSTEEHLFHNFDVDGVPFVINGKIDRVDQHDISGQVAVWDYKTSDRGDPPEKVHYAKRKQEWKDLQLPLYRHLVKEVSAVEGADFSNVAMGYVLLAKNLDEVGFHSAEWEPEVLATADEKAREIIRKIRMGSYEMSGKPPMYSEDFAGICQDFVFEKADPPGLETTVGELPW